MSEWIKCPCCDIKFSVVWIIVWEGPTHCPFCGNEIDYADNEVEDESKDKFD